MIKNRTDIVVLGNHDYEVYLRYNRKRKILLQNSRFPYESKYQARAHAKASWQWTVNEIDFHKEGDWLWLERRLSEILLPQYFTKLVHGSESTDEEDRVWCYLWGTRAFIDALISLYHRYGDKYRMLMFGHTHTPNISLFLRENDEFHEISYYEDNPSLYVFPQHVVEVNGNTLLRRVRFNLRNNPNLRVMVNPGAIVQPRDDWIHRVNFASAMLLHVLDDGWLELEHILIEYDLTKHKEAIVQAYINDPLMDHHFMTIMNYFR